MFLKSQSYNFDAIAHAGAPLGVEWQFLRTLKFSLRSREKRYNCISSRNFFRLLKIAIGPEKHDVFRDVIPTTKRIKNRRTPWFDPSRNFPENEPSRVDVGLFAVLEGEVLHLELLAVRLWWRVALPLVLLRLTVETTRFGETTFVVAKGHG